MGRLEICGNGPRPAKRQLKRKGNNIDGLVVAAAFSERRTAFVMDSTNPLLWGIEWVFIIYLILFSIECNFSYSFIMMILKIVGAYRKFLTNTAGGERYLQELKTHSSHTVCLLNHLSIVTAAYNQCEHTLCIYITHFLVSFF
jgi:hypothetical protein